MTVEAFRFGGIVPSRCFRVGVGRDSGAFNRPQFVLRPRFKPKTICHPCLRRAVRGAGPCDLRPRRGDDERVGEPMRVIAGSLRRRRLRRPPEGVRPTSDRVREALFASLGSLEGARFLDLYAGTGAVGIEAISRGALEVVFVDRSQQSLKVLRENLADLGVKSGVRVLEGDARMHLNRFGERGEKFDLVFVDPPYDSDETSRVLMALRGAGTVNSGGQVVVESAKRNPLASLAGWEVDAEHDYGDSRLTRLVEDVRGPEALGGDSPADMVRAREIRKPDAEK